MKCCGNVMVGVRAPLLLGQVVSLARVVDFRVSNRSSCRPFLNAAERIGGRRPGFADQSDWACLSASRDVFSSNSGRFFGTCCPRVSDLGVYRRTRRDCLAKAEQDEHGTAEMSGDDHEENPEVANIRPPITVKESAFLTSDFLLQVAIFVLAAGFVDAGFSGDWSRIGVLSKHTEEELRMAAIGVVPLAVTLIWSISKRRKNL